MIYRAKYKNVLFEFVIPDSKVKGIIILCSGLPSVPKTKELLNFLSEKGFIAISPRYQGTWESDGEFLKQSPTKDVDNIIEYINKGVFKELYANKVFKIKKSSIFVIGSSFGGTVALSLFNKNIKKIVALSPVVDLTKHGNNGDEQDLIHLGRFIKKAFSNVYRFKDKNWNKMLKGKIFNPPKSINKSAVKNYLIVYDKSDDVVNYKKIEEYAKSNNIKRMILTNIGHLSFSALSALNWNKVINWLLKK